MDKELIKKLSKAGVSAEVILALMLDEDDKPKQEQPKPEQERPKPKQEQPQPEQPAAVGNDAILAAIEKLTGAVQAANIRNMGGNTPKQETADDVLAQIINPTGTEAK